MTSQDAGRVLPNPTSTPQRGWASNGVAPGSPRTGWEPPRGQISVGLSCQSLPGGWSNGQPGLEPAAGRLSAEATWRASPGLVPLQHPRNQEPWRPSRLRCDRVHGSSRRRSPPPRPLIRVRPCLLPAQRSSCRSCWLCPVCLWARQCWMRARGLATEAAGRLRAACTPFPCCC